MRTKVVERPARQVHRHGLQKKVNKIAGEKLSGVQQTESVLESNVAVAAHIDPRVRRVVPQPCTFDLNTGRIYPSKAALFEACREMRYKPAPYTPDFRLHLVDGTQLFVEAKICRQLERHPEVRERVAAVAGIGWRIALVTERDLPEPLVRNIRLLKPIAPSVPSADEKETILRELAQPLPFQLVLNRTGATQGQVLAWIRSGVLRVDLSAGRLGPKSVVAWSKGSSRHLEVLPL